MKFNSIIVFAFVLSAFVLFGCNTGDKTGPLINLMHPMESVSFAPGDTMHVHFTVTEEEAMHEVKVELYKTIDNTYLLDETMHVHDLSYTYMTDVVLELELHTDLMLKVTAEDEAGNTSEESRHFHLHE